ncbi:MAG: DUF5652 family protein [Patescibacteria group bacterium]
MTLDAFFEENFWVLVALMLWVLPWKGYAMWTAARLSHKWWFIALLILNTLAILDIVYVFFVAKKGGELLKLKKNEPASAAPQGMQPQ